MDRSYCFLLVNAVTWLKRRFSPISGDEFCCVYTVGAFFSYTILRSTDLQWKTLAKHFNRCTTDASRFGTMHGGSVKTDLLLSVGLI